MSFSSLSIHPDLLQCIDAQQITEPTKVQSEAIPKILERKDVIGIAATGTGKTLAFLLPLLTNFYKKPSRSPHPRCLILAPTRELAEQIFQTLELLTAKTDLNPILIVGKAGIQKQITDLKSKKPQILVATPGRYLDLRERGHVYPAEYESVVLDEADRMLDMGFLPDIRRILRKVRPQCQKLLFSATLPGQIEQLAREFLQQPALIETSPRKQASVQVEQKAYILTQPEKYDKLIELLKHQELFTVLVFCHTRHDVEALAKQLRKDGESADSLHGDRTQNQRRRCLAAFESGDLRVLVATDLAARGLDIGTITHVINYDFPTQPEDYIHRIGRTGRAHQQGIAITFVEPRQQTKLKKLEGSSGQPISIVDTSPASRLGAPVKHRTKQQKSHRKNRK